MFTRFRPLVPTMEFGLRLNIRRIPNSIGLILVLVLISGLSSAQSDATLSCYGRVNMSINKSGYTFIKPFHLTGIHNTDSLEVIIPDRSIPRLTCNDVGQVVMVTLRDTVSGIVCMNEVYVEDKIDYELLCLDGEVGCEEDLASIDPSLFLMVDDNCLDLSDLIIGFVDMPGPDYPNNSDTIREIKRTWTTTGPNGVVRNCSSIFYIKAFDLDRIVFPPDTMIYCGEDPTDIKVTGDINFSREALVNCGIAVGLPMITSGAPHNCGLSTKYFRTWTVMDWRSGMLRDTIQVIKLVDTSGIKIVAPASFTQISQDCKIGLIIGAPSIMQNCATFSADHVEIIIGLDVFKAGDTAFLDPGTYQVIYRGDGVCPNVAEPDTATVEILDLIAPILVCSDSLNKAISIGTLDSLTILLDSAFKSANVIACDDFHILGRKVDSTMIPSTIPFSPTLTLYLAEAKEKLRIELLVRSDSGLYSDTCIIWIDVQEKVAPQLVLHNDINVEIVDISGMIVIDTSVIIASLGDNSGCISSITITGSGIGMPTSGSGMSMMTGSLTWFTDGEFQKFDCGDLGKNVVKVIVEDCDGNMAMDTSIITISNGGGCPSMASVSGQVLAYGRIPIEGVSISAINNNYGFVSTTDLDGAYLIEDLHVGDAYQVEIAMADLWRTGITAYDVSLLSHYILGIEDLDIYQRASADVDGTNNITIRDVLALQKILMGKPLNIVNDVEPWLFSNKTVNGDLLPYQISEIFVDRPRVLDWKAVKRGDIDGDIIVSGETRSVSNVSLITLQSEGTKKVYRINFGNTSNLRALQASIDDIYGDISIIDSHEEFTINKKDGIISMMYYDSGRDNAEDLELFIDFSTRQSLSKLQFTQNMGLKAFSWDEEGRKSRLQLTFSEEKEEILSINTFSLNAYPNPTSGQTTISIDYNLAATEEAELRIIDAIGRIINSYRVDLDMHTTTKDINLDLSGPSGIYTILLQSADNQIVRRIVKK